MTIFAPDTSLVHIIQRKVCEARSCGLDYVRQTRAAALAVLDVRADMTAHQVLALVLRVRHDTALAACQALVDGPAPAPALLNAGAS